MTDSIIKEARDAFKECSDAENHNRRAALEDIKFSRLGEQWPGSVEQQRREEGRPCLTINKLPAFVRQVVNDARQNKPQIKVHPVDDKADVRTADIINGLIRNIEYTSNAPAVYDTAVEQAVNGGFGYFRIGLDYAYDDSFELDLSIERIQNQFSVYGDPNSTAVDSSDWDVAFIVNKVPHAEYKRKYGDAAKVSWDDDTAWAAASDEWRDDKDVMVAEWWTREEVEREIVLMSDGSTYAREDLENDPDLLALLDVGILQEVKSRVAKSHKVTQRIMSGVEILEENDWPGRYIPIVPVYGEEFDVEGKRYFRSLIHHAKDPQRMFNYWRTSATELVALAPRVPWVGEDGTFDADENWQTANTHSHAYLVYERGSQPPQRQPLDVGTAAGSLQEALNASDDIKSIIGMYDASLGARSNETSGKAILARQREGDVSTFHFIDNMSRAIHHAGRILIDLIPKVYTEARVVRVIGEDESQEAVQINQPIQKQDENGNVIEAMHDLTAGKYDLTVTTGPSYTTQREEAVVQMTELIRAYPDAAPKIADILAKNFDWPGADEIAKRFSPDNGGLPPEIKKQIQEGQKLIQQLQQENAMLKADKSIDAQKVKIDQFEAETDRMQVMQEATQPIY